MNHIEDLAVFCDGPIKALHRGKVTRKKWTRMVIVNIGLSKRVEQVGGVGGWGGWGWGAGGGGGGWRVWLVWAGWGEVLTFGDEKSHFLRSHVRPGRGAPNIQNMKLKECKVLERGGREGMIPMQFLFAVTYIAAGGARGLRSCLVQSCCVTKKSRKKRDGQ